MYYIIVITKSSLFLKAHIAKVETPPTPLRLRGQLMSPERRSGAYQIFPFHSYFAISVKLEKTRFQFTVRTMVHHSPVFLESIHGEIT